MKFYNVIAVSLISLSTVALSGAANASTVNYWSPVSGFDPNSVHPNAYTTTVDMGTVGKNQSGLIEPGYQPFSTPSKSIIPFSNPTLYEYQGEVQGYIPSMSKITFTYNYSGAVGVELVASGNYNTAPGNTLNNLNGTAYADTGMLPYTSGVTGSGPSKNYTGNTVVNGVSTPSLMLVWSSANLTSPSNGSGTGTANIQNNSGVAAYFEVFFTIISTSSNLTNLTTLAYNVSAIPLPASLPLFGALITGMFGFAHFSRQRKKLSVAA